LEEAMPERTTETSIDLGEQLVIMPWPDEPGDVDGHDPRSEYAERFWVGIIGPTATWLLRRFADGFDAWPDGFEIPVQDLAGSLGISGTGRHSPLARTIWRCSQFGLIKIEGAGIVARRHLPPLSDRQVARLPADLRAAHALLPARRRRPIRALSPTP
jgi:hypothetical protein